MKRTRKVFNTISVYTAGPLDRSSIHGVGRLRRKVERRKGEKKGEGGIIKGKEGRNDE